MHIKGKRYLKTRRIFFNISEGRIKVAGTFMKYVDKLFDFLENSSLDSIETKQKVRNHSRTAFHSSTSSRSLLPQKYTEEPYKRIIIAKTLQLFNLLLFLQSTDFLNSVKESECLKSIVDLCELYGDHSLIQAEIRSIFSTIIQMDDINMK